MAIPRKLTENFIETEVDGEVLLVDLAGGELFSLDGTAAAIWRLIDGTHDATAMASLLSDVYAVNVCEVTEDCRTLLADLAKAGLVAF